MNIEFLIRIFQELFRWPRNSYIRFQGFLSEFRWWGRTHARTNGGIEALAGMGNIIFVESKTENDINGTKARLEVRVYHLSSYIIKWISLFLEKRQKVLHFWSWLCWKLVLLLLCSLCTFQTFWKARRPDYIKIHTARLFKVWNLIGFVPTRKRRMFCCQAFLIGPKVSVKGTPMYSVPRSHYLDNSLRNMAVLK